MKTCVITIVLFADNEVGDDALETEAQTLAQNVDVMSGTSQLNLLDVQTSVSDIFRVPS